MGLRGYRPGVSLVNVPKHPTIRQQIGILPFFPLFFLLIQISQLKYSQYPFQLLLKVLKHELGSFLVTLHSVGTCGWLEREFNNSDFTHCLETTPHFGIVDQEYICVLQKWSRGLGGEVESLECLCKPEDLSSDSQHLCKSWVQQHWGGRGRRIARNCWLASLARWCTPGLMIDIV